MSTGSTYRPLAEYLARKKTDSWEASFAEVEEKLGRSLPKSAYRHQAWWANQNGPGHSQTRGWRSVGWRTSKLDLEQQRVTFERDRDRSPLPIEHAASSKGESAEALIDRAMTVSGITDRREVLVAALRQFIDREAVRGLIALGGSAPEFEPAPRDRPWT